MDSVWTLVLVYGLILKKQSWDHSPTGQGIETGRSTRIFSSTFASERLMPLLFQFTGVSLLVHFNQNQGSYTPTWDFLA